MKKINMSKLQKRMGKIISTKEALKDVVPMQWDEDVLSGNKKIIIRKMVK